MAFQDEIQITHKGVTFQGSGHLLGVRQFFVRMAGCAVKHCPIRNDCDEASSFGSQNGHVAHISALVDSALESVGVGGWLHITGGEPTDHMDQLESLVKQAHANGLKVHIQTSGVRAIEFPWDWLTVSPKVPVRKLQQTYGHELLVVAHGQDRQELEDYFDQTNFWYYYLQPLWEGAPRGQAVNQLEMFELAHELCASGESGQHNGRQWLTTIQAHKYWGVK